MSQLKIRSKGNDEIAVNVVSFLSPIFAATASSQTSSSEQHHPIRTQQPNIRFDVIWRSEEEYEKWQTFVRNQHLKLLSGKDPNDSAVVTLWWPERDILNWEGLIKETDGGGQKFNWAPQGVIEVELTKGIVATASAMFSVGTDFEAIYGGGINTIPPVDQLITPPPPPVDPALQPSQTVFDDFLNQVSGAPRTPSTTGPAGSLSSIFPGVVG